MGVDELVLRFVTQGAGGLRANLSAISKDVDVTESKALKLSKSFLAASGASAGAAAGLGLFLNSAVQAGNEAGNASAKLDAMLRARGETGARKDLDAVAASMAKLTGQDDDAFTNTEAHLLSFGLSAQQIARIMPSLVGQANVLDQSLDSVADSFGRAFASGDAGGLTRSGVVMSAADKEAIKLAKSTSEAAGQQELYNRVLASYQQYAGKAGEGVTNAARAQGNFNTQLGNMQELLG
jgi:hypothetical protein